MQPVKITAHLAMPLAGHLPMLDGVLTQHMVKHMPAVRRSVNGHRHESLENAGYRNIPMPLASWNIDGCRIPLCSSPIIPETDADRVTHFARRAELDPDDLRDGQRVKVNRSSGAHKSYYLPRRLWLVQRVVWFAVARFDGSKAGGKRGGALSRLRQRLKKIDAIGGKTAHGWGVVSKWEVEKADADWSWYAQSAHGMVLMRPLPVAMDHPADLVGWRKWFDRPCPPYHDKTQATEVLVPC